jgi:hypothetical protein
MAQAATTPQSPAARLASAANQQATQQNLSLIVREAVLQTWPIIEEENLRITLPQWMAAVYALVHKFGTVAAALAVRYLERTRPRGLGAFTPRAADPAGYEQTVKALKWATKGLWTPNADIPVVQTLVDGAVQKLVADTSRVTYMDTFVRDKQIVAWARVARPNACSFCALLATRGAVYRSQGSADFLAHDHCHCVAVMVYKGERFTSPEYVQHWLDLYKSSTAGKHNADARNAFRRALAAERRNGALASAA